jgi:hypothetical protein
MPPSGFGAMPKVFGGSLTATIANQSASRFSGALAAFVITGTGFTAGSTARVDGSTTGVTTSFTSSTQISVTIGERHTWTSGSKTLDVTTGGVPHSGTGTLTVSQHANLQCEYAPWNSTSRTTSGANLTSLLDLSGNGRNLTVVTGTFRIATAQINGRDAMYGTSTADGIEEASYGTWLQSIGDGQWFRAVQPSKNAANDDGIVGWKAIVSGGGGDWLLGGQSGLITGERWVAAVGGPSRIGSGTYTYTAGTAFVEDVTQTLTATTVYQNGVAQSMNIGTQGNYRPNTITSPLTAKLHLYSCHVAGAAYTLHLLGFNAVLSAAQAIQVRRYLGDLGAITVP